MSLCSLFFPRICPLCGRYTDKEGLCPVCLRFLPRTEQAVLPQNSTLEAVLGKPSDIVAAAKVMHVERAAAFLFYAKDQPVQRLVHKLKYMDQPDIGYRLGWQAAMEFHDADFFDEIGVIVPVPLHPRRLRERGYNQSEYIARGISAYTGIPVDTTHVTRVRYTHQQALMSGKERIANVCDVFAVNHPEQMYHKHILVVDDLVTTGETMRNCLRAMRLFRGAKFTVFALCKTV